MKCEYLDIECDKITKNDKQCAYCLSIKNTIMIKELMDRMDASEAPKTKITGRKSTAKKITGRVV